MLVDHVPLDMWFVRLKKFDTDYGRVVDARTWSEEDWKVGMMEDEREKGCRCPWEDHYGRKLEQWHMRLE